MFFTNQKFFSKSLLKREISNKKKHATANQQVYFKTLRKNGALRYNCCRKHHSVLQRGAMGAPVDCTAVRSPFSAKLFYRRERSRNVLWILYVNWQSTVTVYESTPDSFYILGTGSVTSVHATESFILESSF